MAISGSRGYYDKPFIPDLDSYEAQRTKIRSDRSPPRMPTVKPVNKLSSFTLSQSQVIMDSWDPMTLSKQVEEKVEEEKVKSALEQAKEREVSLMNFDRAGECLSDPASAKRLFPNKTNQILNHPQLNSITVNDCVMNGALNAAGTSILTPLVTLSQERIDGIAERLAFRPHATDPESVVMARNEHLNNEFDEVTEEFTRAVGKSMVDYKIKNTKTAKSLGIDVAHLNAQAEWWTNKQYQVSIKPSPDVCLSLSPFF